ncbi:hypothetical protein [Cyclobacterium sp. SYSU L10401]|uniref:hypothetical protein n=1 Tax=Cyclobacterium sp. SYSU L10401 TaxID=2678657 RepID=UPI0013CFE116|nr:hypothetical protein [Cyclobacterium sp. SYSU L10401]
MIQKLLIGFIIIFTACGEKSSQEQKFSVSIETPLLSDAPNENPKIKNAIEKIIDFLRSKNTPIDSLYLKNYQIDSIPWTFDIQHYNTFVYELQWKREQERVDSLLRIDSTGSVEYYMIPATGNISGYDRWIEYYPKTGEFNDYMLQ